MTDNTYKDDKEDDIYKDDVYIMVIDIETSGPHLTRNDMLCFGACIARFTLNPDGDMTMYILDKLEVYIKPLEQDIRWDKIRLKEFWDKTPNIKNNVLENISTYGVDAKTAMITLCDWIHKQPQYIKNKLIIYTDTNGFDIGFLDYYLSTYDMPTMHTLIDGTYRPIRDASSYHMGVAHSMDLWGAEEKACKKLNIKYDNPYKDDSHNPLTDAEAICYDIFLIYRQIKLKPIIWWRRWTPWWNVFWFQ